MADQFQPSERQIAMILGRQHSKRQMAIAYLRASHERNQLKKEVKQLQLVLEVIQGLDQATEEFRAGDLDQAFCRLCGTLEKLKNAG
ncbi:MAG: hypothetical protein EpisKO_04400 [Epibacterium sp.]